MDRLEVEVALGHPCRDGVGPSGTDSGCEILEDDRLEARLAGIVRHQFGAIPCDGRLALGVQRRRDHEQPAVVIVGVPPAVLRFYTVRSRVWGRFWPEADASLRNVRFMARYHGVQCGMHAMFSSEAPYCTP